MKKHRKNIYRRSDNRFEGRYIVGYQKIYGKAVYQSIYAATYREAIALLEAAEKSVSEKVALERLIRKQKSKNLPVDQLENLAESTSFEHAASSDLSMGQWLAQWLEENKKISVKPSSYTRYSSIVYKHILPQLGEWNLRSVTSAVVQSYVSYLLTEANNGKGAAPSTIKMHLVLLSSFFEKMVADGQLQTNPCENVTLPPTKRKKPVYLKQNEYQKLEKILWDKIYDKKANAVLLALKTGIRLGELAALRWSDIDLESKTLHIRHSIQRVKTENAQKSKTETVFGRTKSACSEREIPMNDGIYRLLSSYRKNLEKDGAVHEESFVFTNEKGSYMDPRTYQKYFAGLLKEAGIRAVNFHALRHTFATVAASRDMQISTLSRILGHSNSSITLQIYVHAVDEQDRIEMSKIEGF